MCYPHFLPENGGIGFTAPPFDVAMELYRSAFPNTRVKFETMSYRYMAGLNASVQEGVGINDTPEARAAEVSDFFIGRDTDILMSLGGGELVCIIPDIVDFPAIATVSFKQFMGLSDNTNLVFPPPTLYDTTAIYGPNASTFGTEPWRLALFDAFGLFTDKREAFDNYPRWQYTALRDEEHPLFPYHLGREAKLRCFCPDSYGSLRETGTSFTLRGCLPGGYLDILGGLAGAPFDHVEKLLERYPDEPILWFFESCDLNVSDIECAL